VPELVLEKRELRRPPLPRFVPARLGRRGRVQTFAVGRRAPGGIARWTAILALAVRRMAFLLARLGGFVIVWRRIHPQLLVPIGWWHDVAPQIPISEGHSSPPGGKP
jgi:hypothetical protein